MRNRVFLVEGSKGRSMWYDFKLESRGSVAASLSQSSEMDSTKHFGEGFFVGIYP